MLWKPMEIWLYYFLLLLVWFFSPLKIFAVMTLMTILPSNLVKMLAFVNAALLAMSGYLIQISKPQKAKKKEKK